MKKIIIFVLCLCLLTSCAVSTPTQSPSALPVPPTAEVTPEPEYEVDIYQFDFTPENFPRMDGTYSSLPLAQAAASILLSVDRKSVSNHTNFTDNKTALSNLLNNEADIVFVYAPNGELEALGDVVEYAAIATDALVFLVNSSNSVTNLTTSHIQTIFSSTGNSWAAFGGSTSTVVPFLNPASTVSHSLLKTIMGENSLIEPTIEYVDGDTGYLSNPSGSASISYDLYYRSQVLNPDSTQRAIYLDGVAPTYINIKNGTYPVTCKLYAVIRSSATLNSPERVLYKWLQGELGQQMIGLEGLAPAK